MRQHAAAGLGATGAAMIEAGDFGQQSCSEAGRAGVVPPAHTASAGAVRAVISRRPTIRRIKVRLHPIAFARHRQPFFDGRVAVKEPPAAR
jgi:hypothetical protein